MLGFGFLAVFWGNFGQSFFISWFGAGIQESLELSASAYGAIYSAATLASAVTVVWLGGLIDRVPLKKYTIGVALGLSLAAFTLSLAHHVFVLLAGFYLLRLFGQALLPHTGMTTISRYYKQNRGKAISIASSGVPAGEVVLPLAVVALIGFIGWHATFATIAVLTPLVFIPLALWLQSTEGFQQTLAANTQARPPTSSSNSNKTPEHSPTLEISAGRRAVLSDYRFWLVLPGIVSSPFIVTGVFIQQNFIIDEKGWSALWLATCFTIYGISHWLSSIFAGSLVDKYGAVKLLAFCPLPMLAGLLLLALAPGQWVAPAVMALLAMSIGGSHPINGSLWPEIYGTQYLGSIRSMNIAIMVFSTSISPILLGYFIDSGASISSIFMSCALYVFVGMLMMLVSYPLNPTQFGQHGRGNE